MRTARTEHFLVGALLIVSGCNLVDASGTSATSGAAEVVDQIPAIGMAKTTVSTRTIATGFTAPLLGVTAPGVADTIFVVDQIGIVWRVDVTSGAKSKFLDVRSLLVPIGIAGLGGYDERGLLGLVFDPGFATNGLFYTYTSEPATCAADFTFPKIGCGSASLAPDHQNVLREWHVSQPCGSNMQPQPHSRVVMRVDWTGYNHNGGMLAFGNDGMLYMSLGDGGGEDDQTCQIYADGRVTIGHEPQGNAQDLGLPYGKIFRIDPHARTSRNGQYGIPADNPRIAGALPEIYAAGLRNFWRYSFDPTSGALIGGDVGQNDIEEIDVIRAGGNYGWRQKEGTALFDPHEFAQVMGDETDGSPTRLAPGTPAGLIDPIAQYAHNHDGKPQARATIGGFVYRGTELPALAGKYIFGDYTKKSGMTPGGRLLALDQMRDSDLGGYATGKLAPRGRESVDSLIPGTLDIDVLGFALDPSGEIYVLGNSSGIPQGSTGELRKLVP